MAETGKKAKAPAKPKAASTITRKSATKKTAPAEGTVEATPTPTQNKLHAVTPTHEEIAHLARQYWSERGHQDGYAEQDWLRAEQELRAKAS